MIENRVYGLLMRLGKKFNSIPHGGSGRNGPTYQEIFCLYFFPIKKHLLSKPKHNSNTMQLGLRLNTKLTWNPPTPNFQATSRPARELKFGTDTH